LDLDYVFGNLALKGPTSLALVALLNIPIELLDTT